MSIPGMRRCGELYRSTPVPERPDANAATHDDQDGPLGATAPRCTKSWCRLRAWSRSMFAG
jgi:hypothetical protein